MKNKTRQNQEKVFKELFERHKGSPMAVSSESKAHKKLRYDLITDIFEKDDNISIHDVGMGLADMWSYIKEMYPHKNIEYSGSEILKEYVDASMGRYPDINFYHRDVAERAYDDRYDYLLMSGLFHQKRESTIPDWETFASNIIRNSFQMCNKGIAFNFISPFVDFYQENVYYSNMPKFITFINDELSRFFELKHNYVLFEYTVYVYKEDYIRELYPQKEFVKYFKK